MRAPRTTYHDTSLSEAVRFAQASVSVHQRPYSDGATNASAPAGNGGSTSSRHAAAPITTHGMVRRSASARTPGRGDGKRLVRRNVIRASSDGRVLNSGARARPAQLLLALYTRPTPTPLGACCG